MSAERGYSFKSLSRRARNVLLLFELARTNPFEVQRLRSEARDPQPSPCERMRIAAEVLPRRYSTSPNSRFLFSESRGWEPKPFQAPGAAASRAIVAGTDQAFRPLQAGFIVARPFESAPAMTMQNTAAACEYVDVGYREYI